MKAAEMRKRSPESCARTAIADALQLLHIEAGRGAKTVRQVRDTLAAHILDKLQPLANIEASDAQALVGLLGLDVADKTGRAALKLLADGPLAGFYIAGTRHTPARLLLADLLAAAVAQTPTARVKLPLALPSGITAQDRTTPASAPVETPFDGTFFAPGISRTRGVANKASASPKNPELARAVLPPGAQVARTFELCVAAWRVSPSWGQAPLADLARSLVPDDLYRGQEQVQRGLKSLVRAGILREHGAGVVLAWQPVRRLTPGPLAVALMSWSGAVQQIDPARQRADLAAARRLSTQANDALSRARENLGDDAVRAAAALDVAVIEARALVRAALPQAHVVLTGTLNMISKAQAEEAKARAKTNAEAYRQADIQAAEVFVQLDALDVQGADDLVLDAWMEVAMHPALLGDQCPDRSWMAPFVAQRREAERTYSRTLNKARSPIWQCQHENQMRRDSLRQNLAECRQAADEARKARKAADALTISDAMLAMLERWGIDARTLARADANKLGRRLYFWIVQRRQAGLDPLGPRERLATMLSAGVPLARIEGWATNDDATVSAVARAIRRGVNPVGLWAIFEAAPATPAIELTAEPGQSIDDLDEAAALFWDADMTAANGDASDDAGWADMLDEPELLRVDLSHWSAAAVA